MRLGIFITTVFFAATTGATAQIANDSAIPKYRTPGASTETRDIVAQRTAITVGIPKVLNRIPSKSYEVLLEVYENDPESLNLRENIKQYLRENGYTNVKSNVHTFFGEDFKYRPCDVAILDDSISFVLFIPPCNKAYKNP